MADNPNPPPQNEEELIPLEDLLALADVDEADLDHAIVWWDENASEDWKGALE